VERKNTLAGQEIAFLNIGKITVEKVNRNINA
jgi:hypothetical protein